MVINYPWITRKKIKNYNFGNYIIVNEKKTLQIYLSSKILSITHVLMPYILMRLIQYEDCHEHPSLFYLWEHVCFCVHLDTSKSYVNHSLPDRPDFYRSIHLQKAHLVGESLGTVVFCMVTTSTCFCDTLQ